jgi:endogenous inhibitor of DNA gyrase (YacG/DUF329 family)
MGKTFIVEIRTDCKICGKPLDLKKRQRSYCSKECRNKVYTHRYAVQRNEWQRNNRGKAPEVEGTKVQCPICEKWYVQLGTHVIQRHEYETAREFREDNGLDVKRGTVPEWYKELKGEIAMENDTVKNLKSGKKFWFKKHDPRAGQYKRSQQTLDRLRQQGLKIGKEYGGLKGGENK